MSKEKDKKNFFKSLKKTIFNTKAVPAKNNDLNTAIGSATTKSVNHEAVKVDLPIYESVSNSKFLDERFAENFVVSGGKFVYCQSENIFFNYLRSLKEEKNWNHIYASDHELLDFLSYNDFQRDELGILMESSSAGISYCYNLSANDGVIVLTPEQTTSRKSVSFPKVHIVIAYKNQLKEDINKAKENFNEKFEGRLPSILELHEGKPVSKANHKNFLSAEGPKNVYLFYIDQDAE